jgi:hypothetical protein
MEAGQPTPGLPRDETAAEELTGPLAIDTVTPAEDWQSAWRETEAERRASSPWAANQEVA